MKYMLDTNICICVIKHKPDTLIKRFLSYDPEELCISAITYAELMHGVEKSIAADRNRIATSLFLSPITILEFDGQAAEEYGRIKAALEKKEMPIGPMGTLIASHAKSRGLILVTNNTK